MISKTGLDVYKPSGDTKPEYGIDWGGTLDQNLVVYQEETPFTSIEHTFKRLIRIGGVVEIKSIEEEGDNYSLWPISVTLPVTPLRNKMKTYSLRQFPPEEPNCFFYYFTDKLYRSDSSKFRLLDKKLVEFGRFRTDADVTMIDRDRISSENWDILLNAFNIDNYPALLVSSEELGIQDMDMNDPDSLTPTPGVEYVKLQKGVVNERLYTDLDKIQDLLNELHEGAKENNLKATLRKRRAREGYNLTKEAIKEIVSRIPTKFTVLVAILQHQLKYFTKP